VIANTKWFFSPDHGQPCQVIETQTLWGETTCRVWLPGRDTIVRVPASRLQPLEYVGTGSPDHIAYVAAAARVADALTQDVLLAPIESTVIPLPHQIKALNRAISHDRVRYLLADEVGLGKTTAVAAYLIRRARDEGLRRFIIIAPFTNILTQTAERLRKALVLPGEDASRVLVEHHHRADFADRRDRDLAALWHAPIVLTTAVSFFETLAVCDPATLRKLHSVPGSAIFLDEAHAALTVALWPQNWRWTNELADDWGCRFVFASGSLARFWEHCDLVDRPAKLPDLLPREQAAGVMHDERRRVKYVAADGGRVLNVAQLMAQIGRAHV